MGGGFQNFQGQYEKSTDAELGWVMAAHGSFNLLITYSTDLGVTLSECWPNRVIDIADEKGPRSCWCTLLESVRNITA